jgi:hypothetical protein
MIITLDAVRKELKRCAQRAYLRKVARERALLRATGRCKHGTDFTDPPPESLRLQSRDEWRVRFARHPSPRSCISLQDTL